MSTPAAISLPKIEKAIRTLRGQRVFLDADLAEMYGLEVRVFNQAVKQNAKRFPDDFRFQLSEDEAAALRSQSVTSKGRGGCRYPPRLHPGRGGDALQRPEQPRAVEVNIEIMRAFVHMRKAMVAHSELLKRLGLIDVQAKLTSAELGLHGEGAEDRFRGPASTLRLVAGARGNERIGGVQALLGMGLCALYVS